MTTDTAATCCPHESKLAALGAGLLPAGEMSRILAHVMHCDGCLAKLRGAGFTPGDLPPADGLHKGDTIKAQANASQGPEATTSEHHTAVTSAVSGLTPWESSGRPLLSPPEGPGEIGRLGGYRILRVLGEGGMGIVFEAQDLDLARHVAIKVLRPGEITPDQRKRFLQEAQLAASISSDRIVTVHRVGEDNGAMFIVMELLNGESLENRLKNEQSLPVAEALRITREVAEGLAAAHDKHLVHRDIKPANVWLEAKRTDDTAERVKLLDFGVARPMAVHEHLTQSGNIVGTPCYMSPEQACGSEIDQRSDLFSLGCLLYAMLTGRSPFERANYLHTLRAVVDEAPRPLGEMIGGLPSRVGNLVDRLLQKDAAARPATARQVASEIRQIEQQHSVEMLEGPGFTTFRPALSGPRVRIGWGVWIAAATILIAILLGAAGQYHQWTGHLASLSEEETAPKTATVESKDKIEPKAVATRPASEKEPSHAAAPPAPHAAAADVAKKHEDAPSAKADAAQATAEKTAEDTATDSASDTHDGMESSDDPPSTTEDDPAAPHQPSNDGESSDDNGEAAPVAPASPDLPSIKIGVIHSLTGPMAASEAPIVDAVLMAVHEINEAGGLLGGRPIEAIVRDGRSNELVFASQAEDLIENERVVALFGCWRSPCRKLVEEVCQRHNHLLVFPTTYEGLEASPNVIYMGGAPNQQVLPAVKWSFAFLNKRKFFLIGVEGIYSRSVNQIIRDELKILGGEVVGEDYRNLGEVDFTEVANKVIASKADVIINSVSGAGNISLVHCLRKAGIQSADVPMISFRIAEIELQNAIADPDELVGDYSAMSYFASLPDENNQYFLERFRARYGPQRTVSDPMMAAFNGVYLWARAVYDCETARTSAVREAMLDEDFDSPEGEIRIDRANHHAWRRALIGQVNQDLQFDIVWSSPRAIEPNPFPASRSKEQWEAFQQAWKKRWNGGWRADAPRK